MMRRASSPPSPSPGFVSFCPLPSARGADPQPAAFVVLRKDKVICLGTFSYRIVSYHIFRAQEEMDTGTDGRRLPSFHRLGTEVGNTFPGYGTRAASVMLSGHSAMLKARARR